MAIKLTGTAEGMQQYDQYRLIEQQKADKAKADAENQKRWEYSVQQDKERKAHDDLVLGMTQVKDRMKGLQLGDEGITLTPQQAAASTSTFGHNVTSVMRERDGRYRFYDHENPSAASYYTENAEIYKRTELTAGQLWGVTASDSGEYDVPGEAHKGGPPVHAKVNDILWYDDGKGNVYLPEEVAKSPRLKALLNPPEKEPKPTGQLTADQTLDRLRGGVNVLAGRAYPRPEVPFPGVANDASTKNAVRRELDNQLSTGTALFNEARGNADISTQEGIDEVWAKVEKGTPGAKARHKEALDKKQKFDEWVTATETAELKASEWGAEWDAIAVTPGRGVADANYTMFTRFANARFEELASKLKTPAQQAAYAKAKANLQSAMDDFIEESIASPNAAADRWEDLLKRDILGAK